MNDTNRSGIVSGNIEVVGVNVELFTFLHAQQKRSKYIYHKALCTMYTSQK